MVLELTEPGSQARHLLTVGVTPGQITTLHCTPVNATTYASVAAGKSTPTS
jgi:flagellar biogenesis protein FliO